MNKRLRWAALAVLVVSFGGCRCFAPPNFSHPGSASYQQSRAERFDPYPENEPGPAIAGGRPLEYDKPAAEVGRARWATGSLGRP